ncbi:hypothetical protein C6T66_09730 [Burkholderia multivorans]|uniref:Uncharacterized protein n=1 Tax=Burkholderia multivorans TaxID=87883 RepID=A0A8E2RTC2_9BURK|nr:hypothetical protein C6P76_13775 [Burkholderia multivorans]PRE28769.1 hypothetical protein C6P79_10570 [Burkholderia multivorans]PRF20954.1 hypothetical protein C6P98_19385 [Burkholderia multivorans]PRF22550.1 hypothetical protein C6Q03_16065 [Burkholderia multivorans]PRG88704.1 hypothetical protein C6T66_09730 [Burkholderia multivorans]
MLPLPNAALRAAAEFFGHPSFARRAPKPGAGVGGSAACFGYLTPHRASPPRQTSVAQIPDIE